jgi:hypothetical protein
MNKWKCDADMISNIMDVLCINDYNLFDFTLANTDFLVEEDAYYKVEWEQGCEKRTYYNVYVCPTQFASIYLNDIARYIFEQRYPEFHEHMFTMKERRFKENIHNLPMDINTKINDIDTFVLCENDLTIKDILDIYTATDKESVMDEIKPYTRFSVYSDGCIFLKVSDKYSLYLTIEDIENKNWDAVEKRHVFSIPLYDKNGERISGEWFEGNQKDAPYFNEPLVREIKKFFEKK